MTDPLVSVIIPTYNRAASLLEAAKSVLNQTYTHLEVIIVDDASTDDTGVVIASLSDTRIRTIRLAENVGASSARNAGIAEARGEWIAFQDSDDLWLPTKLRRQMDGLLAEPGKYAASYTSYWRDDGTTREALPRARKGLSGDVLPGLLRFNFISTQVLVLHRDIAKKVGGFDSKLTALNDWDYVIRMAQLCHVLWIPEPLVEYRLQADSLTNSHERFLENYRMMMDKHRALLMPDAAAEAWHWAAMGNRLCQDGALRKGRPHLAHAWRLRPMDHRYAGAWLSTWLTARMYRALSRWYARRT